MQYEQFGADESYDSEEEEDDGQGGAGDLEESEPEVVEDGDRLGVIDGDAEGIDAVGQGEDDLNIKDLYAGVQSLIQGD